MAVDTSVIGTQTGAWRVVLDRAVLANFAKAVGDTSPVYRRRRGGRARPDSTRFPRRRRSRSRRRTGARSTPTSSRADPTAGKGNPMHKIMGELFAQGALVLHGEQEFVYHRPPVAGDVLDGVQSITDIYEKETDAARMTFVVMETVWSDAASPGSKANRS